MLPINEQLWTLINEYQAETGEQAFTVTPIEQSAVLEFNVRASKEFMSFLRDQQE